MTQIGGPEDRDTRDPQTYAIIGAAMEVHRVLGSKFLEAVYHSALEMEFEARGVPHTRQVGLPVYYKGTKLSVGYRADFICYGAVLVELKAMDRLTSREDAQVINYLAASGLGRGILLNFGSSSLQFRRFVGPQIPSPASSVQSVESVGPVGRKP